MKYRLLDEETLGQMIDFLDTIQIEAAKGKYKDDTDKINMCSYFISEILHANEAMEIDDDEDIEDIKQGDGLYIDMPEMDLDKKDWGKMLEQLDAFFAGWQKAYNKSKKKNSKRKKKEFVEDLIGDEKINITLEEKFELYYAEREMKKKLKEAKSMAKMLKELGLSLEDEDLN